MLRALSLLWGVNASPPPDFDASYHPDEIKFYSSVQGFPGLYMSNPHFISPC